MAVELIFAGDIKVGDKIFFPSSRKAREVTGIEHADSPGDVVRVQYDNGYWMLSTAVQVKRETTDEEE